MFSVNLECDDDDDDCDPLEDYEEEEEEQEERNRYTWEDFYPRTGIPPEYPGPPPRFQRTELPPRRGWSVTPGVP